MEIDKSCLNEHVWSVWILWNSSHSKARIGIDEALARRNF